MQPATQTQLYRAMLASGNYDGPEDALDAIQEMRQRVVDGEDPEEILHYEGFEPDYIFDII